MRAEQNDLTGAEKYLKAALKYDPQLAQAAYNLCILLSGDRLEEAIGFCREASALDPADPRYAYTLAYYLRQKGETAEAITTLKSVVEQHPEYGDTRSLLREMAPKDEKP